MSALENPELEAGLAGMMVLNELYSRGAFSEDIAVVVENYGAKVHGVLFGFDNGLLRKIPNKDDSNPSAYLTPAGKKIVEEQVALLKERIGR